MAGLFSERKQHDLQSQRLPQEDWVLSAFAAQQQVLQPFRIASVVIRHEAAAAGPAEAVDSAPKAALFCRRPFPLQAHAVALTEHTAAVATVGTPLGFSAASTTRYELRQLCIRQSYQLLQ